MFKINLINLSGIATRRFGEQFAETEI